jgi:hypothetical protein
VLGDLAAHTRPAPGERHDEREQARRGDAERRRLAHRNDAEGDAGGERRHRQDQVDPAQQPAVPQPDLAAPGREPAERHPAGGPLEQHRRGVEADHGRAG